MNGERAVTSPASGLERVLVEKRHVGRKLLVPYLTGGMGDDWLLTLEAVAAAGADAVEVGIPFSDPMIDGPTIQEASLRALERGTTPEGVLGDLSRVDVGIPVVVMTYYNIVLRAGHERAAGTMSTSGVSGAIIPDLPLEELGPWAEAAAPAGIATVLLVAPSTPDDRMELICERSRGFIYAVGRMGVTGEQRRSGRHRPGGGGQGVPLRSTAGLCGDRGLDTGPGCLSLFSGRRRGGRLRPRPQGARRRRARCRRRVRLRLPPSARSGLSGGSCLQDR